MDSKINLVPSGALGAGVGTAEKWRPVCHSEGLSLHQLPDQAKPFDVLHLVIAKISSIPIFDRLSNVLGFVEFWRKIRRGRGGSVTRLWPAPPIQWWMERRWWSRAWWWSIWQAWLHPVCLRQEDWSTDETHGHTTKALARPFVMTSWTLNHFKAGFHQACEKGVEGKVGWARQL